MSSWSGEDLGFGSDSYTQDKITALNDATNTKVDNLASKVGPKYSYYDPSKDKGPYEQNQLADMDKSYSIVNGTRQDNQNKLWNNLSDQEYQALYGYAVGNYGLYQDAKGNYRFNKDNSLYDGNSWDTERLYIGTGKEGDQALKMGQARGDLNSSEARYTPGMIPKYGAVSGPQGIDIEHGKVSDVLLPKNVANMLEEARHGNINGLSTRTATSKHSDIGQALGEGYSEYYNNPQGTQFARIDQDGKPITATDVRLTDANNNPVATGLFNFGGQTPEGFKANDLEQVKVLFNKYLEQSNRGLRIPENAMPTSIPEQQAVTNAANKIGIDRNQMFGKNAELIKNIDADSMGITDRAANLVKGMASTFGKSLVLDTVDWIGETLKRQTNSKVGWDLGSEDTKQEWMDRLTGYNNTFEQRGNEEASKYASKIYNGYKDNGNVDWSDAWNLIKTGLKTPEYLANSLAYLGGMLIGAGKFTAVGKATQAASKAEQVLKSATSAEDIAKATKNLSEARAVLYNATLAQKVNHFVVDQGLSNNAGLLTMAAGQANNDIDEYKKANNGESPSAAHVMGIMAADTGLLAIDKVTDIAILKGALNKEFIPKQKELIQNIIENTPKSAQMATKLAKHVTETVTKLTAAGMIEGATEYAQTVGQLVAQQYGSEKYKDQSISDLATSKENVVQGIQGAGLGAGMGAEMHLAGSAGRAVVNPKVADTLGKMYDAGKGVFKGADVEEQAAQTADQEYAEQVLKAMDSGQLQTPEANVYATKGQDRIQHVDTLEQMLQDKNSSLMNPTAETTSTEVPNVRSYGADPKSQILNAVEAVASNKGTINNIDQVKANAKAQGITDKEFQDAIETGQAVYSLRGTGVTGKYSEDVAEEVRSGPRGFVTYYDAAKLANSTGDREKLYETADKLDNFINTQEAKLAALKSAEQEIRADIESQIELNGGNRQATLKKIENGKQTLEATWGHNGSMIMPYRLVAQDMLTNGNTSASGGLFYKTINEISNELPAMRKAYEGIQRLIGKEPETKTITKPKYQEQPVQVKVPQGTDILTGKYTEKSESKPVIESVQGVKVAEQVQPKVKEKPTPSTKLTDKLSNNAKKSIANLISKRQEQGTNNEDIVKELANRFVSFSETKDMSPEDRMQLAKDIVTPEKADSIPKSVSSSKALLEDRIRGFEGVAVNSGVNIGTNTTIDKLFIIDKDNKVNTISVEDIPTSVNQLVTKFAKGLLNTLKEPEMENEVVTAKDSANDMGRLFLFKDNGKINHHTALAMVIGVVNFMNNNIGELTRAKSVEELQKIFEPDATPMLFNRFNNGGMLGKIAFDEVGDYIVQQLGIKANEASAREMAALKSSLGTMAMIAAQNEGWIKDMMDYDNVSIYNKDAFTQGVKKDNSVLALVIGTDKLVNDREVLANVKDSLNDELGLDVAEQKTYSFEKPERNKVKIRRQGFVEPTKEHVDAIYKLQETPYELNSGVEELINMFSNKGKLDTEELISFLQKNTQGLTKDSLEGVTSANNRIKKLVEEFNTLIEQGKDKEVYFNWFIAKNLRLHLNSTTVNPQDDKQLSRWLLTASNSHIDMNKADIEDYLNGEQNDAAMFIYGIVQAFDGGLPDEINVAVDKGVDKGDTENMIRKAGKALLDTDTDKLYEYAKKSDHLGHALLAIANIKKYKEAQDKFTSDMVIEVDGLTNGLAFKMLQAPVSNPQDWLPRTGVLLENSKYFKADNMNQVRSMGLDDSYITGGKLALDEMQKVLPELMQSKPMKVVHRGLQELGLVPRMDGDVLNTPEGFKFIRTLIKSPMTVFNYGAGSNSIEGAVVKDLLQRGTPVKVNGKKYSRIDALHRIAMSNPNKLKELGFSDDFITGLRKLGKQSYDSKDPYIMRVRLTLENYLRELFAKPVINMLNNEFAEQVSINKSINEAMELMHKAFMDRFKEVEGKTAKEQEQWLKDNIDIVPGFWGVNSKSDAEKLVVLKTGFKSTNGYVDVKTKRNVGRGKEEAIRSNPIERTFVTPGVAASPIGVHGMDASTMVNVLNSLNSGFLAIHDAIVLGMGQKLGSENYNKMYYIVNKEYNMLEEVLRSLEKFNKKLNLSSYTAGKKSKNTNIKNINNILKDLKWKLKEVKDARDYIFAQKAKIGQMAGVIGTMAEVKGQGKASKPDTSKLVETPKETEYTNEQLEQLNNENVEAYTALIEDSMYCKD